MLKDYRNVTRTKWISGLKGLKQIWGWCVCSNDQTGDPRGFKREYGKFPRRGWHKELRPSTHLLGCKIRQYREIQAKPRKITQGNDCQTARGVFLPQDQCLEMCKWSPMLTRRRERRFLGMADKTQIAEFANSQCKSIQ